MVPLGTTQENATVEDTWVLATYLFDPCYIAGWSAAEHWGLTEQIFRSTFVATASHIRRTSMTVLGAHYRISRIPMSRMRGVTHVWRGGERVLVSSPERTIVDAAREPAWLGGVRHLAAVLREYSGRPGQKGRGSAGGTSNSWSDAALATTLMEFGNGAAAKRVGYLVEKSWPEATRTLQAAMQMKTSGAIKLDPAVRSRGKLFKRWGLWINTSAIADA